MPPIRPYHNASWKVLFDAIVLVPKQSHHLMRQFRKLTVGCLVGCTLLLGGGSLVGAGAKGRVRNLPNEEDNLLRTGSLGVMAGEGAPS